jgi:DNA-binding transcriptional MerR regulator
MRIKEVEKITGITSKNIRFYEKRGLLSPESDVENSYRLYSDDDLKRLKKIKLLRKFGISHTGWWKCCGVNGFLDNHSADIGKMVGDLENRHFS